MLVMVESLVFIIFIKGWKSGMFTPSGLKLGLSHRGNYASNDDFVRRQIYF